MANLSFPALVVPMDQLLNLVITTMVFSDPELSCSPWHFWSS
jgi:hypothetical protein